MGHYWFLTGAQRQVLKRLVIFWFDWYVPNIFNSAKNRSRQGGISFFAPFQKVWLYCTSGNCNEIAAAVSQTVFHGVNELYFCGFFYWIWKCKGVRKCSVSPAQRYFSNDKSKNVRRVLQYITGSQLRSNSSVIALKTSFYPSLCLDSVC